MCNANGNKNSILPFVWQTSSVLLKSGRKSLKLALKVKGFSQMEHEFLFGTFRLDKILSWSGRTGLPFQMFCCSRKLSTGTSWKAAFHFCLFNRTFRKRLVNGIQPLFPLRWYGINEGSAKEMRTGGDERKEKGSVFLFLPFFHRPLPRDAVKVSRDLSVTADKW